jgi:hypothetical protein
MKMSPNEVARAFINLLRKKRSGTSWKELNKIVDKMPYSKRAYVYNVVKGRIS